MHAQWLTTWGLFICVIGIKSVKSRNINPSAAKFAVFGRFHIIPVPHHNPNWLILGHTPFSILIQHFYEVNIFNPY